MFNSKYYTIVIVVAFVVLSAAVGVQALEMKEFNLFNSLSNRFYSKSDSSAVSAAPVKAAAPAKAAEAPVAAPAN
jgi:acid phosphatase family membrane protein YuiD